MIQEHIEELADKFLRGFFMGTRPENEMLSQLKMRITEIDMTSFFWGDAHCLGQNMPRTCIFNGGMAWMKQSCWILADHLG